MPLHTHAAQRGLDSAGYPPSATVVDPLVAHPPALLLVKDGRMLRRNMRHELITEDELMSQLRHQGRDDLKLVKRAYHARRAEPGRADARSALI